MPGNKDGDDGEEVVGKLTLGAGMVWLAENHELHISTSEDPLNKIDNSLFPEPPAAASTSAALRERTRALITEY